MLGLAVCVPILFLLVSAMLCPPLGSFDNDRWELVQLPPDGAGVGVGVGIIPAASAAFLANSPIAENIAENRCPLGSVYFRGVLTQ